MSRTDLARLLAGAVFVLLGVGLVYVPAAVILAGLGLAAPVLLRDVRTDDEKEQRR